MKLGYIRVSSKDQNEARQVEALISAGVDPSRLYVDKASGKDFNREQYKSLLRALRTGDVLVIKSLDRLGRNYEEIRKQFKLITEMGVAIHVLDTPMLNTDQVITGDLTMKFISDIILAVLGYVAEQERHNIKQRQAEGIRVAQSKGKRFGRPSTMPSNYLAVRQSVLDGNLTVIEACKVMNISRKTYYNYQNSIKG
jgi:DNA invertase Pin-like site-specific DNA recombinase